MGDHIETIEADITAHAGRMDDINTMLTDGLTDHDTRITTIESSINVPEVMQNGYQALKQLLMAMLVVWMVSIETLTDGPTNHETRIATIESSINDAGGYAERISSAETAVMAIMAVLLVSLKLYRRSHKPRNPHRHDRIID